MRMINGAAERRVADEQRKKLAIKTPSVESIVVTLSGGNQQKVVLGKMLSCGLGAFIAGNDGRTSLRVGMGLSQIGDFSFIIAALGMTLQVTSDFLYPVAVAVSVITTFTTPYMIGFSGRVSDWVTLKMPEKWKNRLYKYSLGTQQVTEASDWKKLIRF